MGKSGTYMKGVAHGFGLIVSSNIRTALDRLDELREGVNKWPPVNSGEHRKSNTIKQVLDEEMGYLD